MWSSTKFSKGFFSIISSLAMIFSHPLASGRAHNTQLRAVYFPSIFVLTIAFFHYDYIRNIGELIGENICNNSKKKTDTATFLFAVIIRTSTAICLGVPLGPGNRKVVFAIVASANERAITLVICVTVTTPKQAWLIFSTTTPFSAINIIVLLGKTKGRLSVALVYNFCKIH